MATTLSTKAKMPGWIIFFLIQINLGSIIGIWEIWWIDVYWDASLLDIIGRIVLKVVIPIFTLGFALYVLFNFVRRQPNAVASARYYLIFLIMFGSLNLSLSVAPLAYGGHLDAYDIDYLGRLSAAFACCIAWLVYFSKSKRLAIFSPKKQRVALKRDKALLWTSILLFALKVSIVFFDI